MSEFICEVKEDEYSENKLSLWVSHSSSKHSTGLGELTKGQLKTVADTIYKSLDGEAQPIPCKVFDISKVEWSVISGIVSAEIDSDSDLEVEYNNVEYNGGGIIIYETKQDVINKAKALGVTAEDLK